MSDKKMNRAMSRIRAMETAYAATLEAERVSIFGTEDKERSIILRAQDAVDHAIKELYEIADPYADFSPNAQEVAGEALPPSLCSAPRISE